MFDEATACHSSRKHTIKIVNNSPEKETTMTTEINVETATAWLEDHYKNVPGIWEQFDLDAAADSLDDAMTDLSTEMCGDKTATFGMDGGIGYCEVCGRGYEKMNHTLVGDYNDLPTLDLMCIMADAKI